MISVLYVDDEPDLLELGKLFLEQNGTFVITTVQSGRAALENLKSFSYDAIIADYLMLEMNGIALLREIRSTSDIPFILFTGKGREEVVIDAINSGADFYLQKGGDPEAQFAELGHKIQQAVSRKRAEHALHNRLEMIKQTSNASTRFIRLPADQIDTAINELLASLGTQAGADHCYVAQKTRVQDDIIWTHEWSLPGSISLKSQLGAVNSMNISWTAKQIVNFEAVNVPRVDTMPEKPGDAAKLKAWLQKIGIKSFLILPLTIGPTVIGSLGLGTTQKEVNWPDEDIDILKIYCQIIAGALARKSADRAIHESEELYRTVFESTGTAMMILEEDKTVSVVNREFERISDYTRNEVIGKIKWTQFVSTEDVERMKEYHVLRRTNPSAVPKNYEFRFLSRDGKKISTYITVEIIPGTKKSVVSLIDISKEKIAQNELADSEEKFRSLTESLAEGIYMMQDNRFIYVNPAFAKICGRTVEELIAMQDYCEIFPEDVRERVRKAVAERLAGSVMSEQYTVNCRKKDGTLIPVTIHGAVTRYKGRAAIIGSLTEIKDP